MWRNFEMDLETNMQKQLRKQKHVWSIGNRESMRKMLRWAPPNSLRVKGRENTVGLSIFCYYSLKQK